MAAATRGERLAARLLADPQRLLSTIIIGNLFVNVFLASLIAATTRLFFDRQGVPLAIFASTLLLLVFGEVTPRSASEKGVGSAMDDLTSTAWAKNGATRSARGNFPPWLD